MIDSSTLTRLALVTIWVAAWAGSTLLAGEFRRLSRHSLSRRLGPYGASQLAPNNSASTASIDSFRELIGQLSRTFGERAARLLGVSEDLGTRLARIHSPLDVTAFRMRQVGWSLASLLGASTAVLALDPPPVLSLTALLAAPALAFLVQEQRLSSASAAWKRRLFLELPVVAEQLAMLVSAGFSLGAALSRIAARGQGVCARDIERVTVRIRQGLSEREALHEWSSLARVDALDRIVSLLALNSEASNLGHLLSIEARSVRREVHRNLVATMERRGQQVWIPVTVAALVPGVIFLVIPFVQALRLFAGS